MKKMLLLILVLVLAVGLFCACSKSDPLVGNWVCESVQSGYPDQMTLYADGTGKADGASINWYKEGSEFSFTWLFGSHTYEYHVNGSTLYLDDYKYTKK